MQPIDLATAVVLAISTALATVFGLLPERIDLTFVLAAYGVGAILGELVASRRELDRQQLARRYGTALMTLAAVYLVGGLIAGVIS